jgi:hypothetical protein
MLWEIAGSISRFNRNQFNAYSHIMSKMISGKPMCSVRSIGSLRKSSNILSVCLIFLPAFLALSCTPVAMLIYGVHQPSYKSDDAVIHFANRLDVEREIYRLNGYSEESISRFRYTGNSMPGMLLFNSKGELIKFELNCSGGLDSIASLSLHDIDQMPLAGESFQDFMEDTYVINTSKSDNVSKLTRPMFVIKFAEYGGLLNKNSVPGLVSQLESRNDVDYILLNVDYTVRK